MKKISHLLLMLILPAFIMTGCSDDDKNDDKQIELPNQSEKTQTAFADDETTGGFTFTAQSSWTATVKETAPTGRSVLSGTRASDVSWLRLLLDGSEKYSGDAGKFTLTIELDPNYSGETRSATITIKSGDDSITITVTQDGKTEQGEVPTEPTQKRVKKLSITSTHPESAGRVTTGEFEYDNQGRVTKLTNVNFDGVGTQSVDVYNYVSSTKVTGTHTYTNGGGDGAGSFTLTLNAEGLLVSSEDSYKMNYESKADKITGAYEYSDGYLSKVTELSKRNYDEYESKKIIDMTWTSGNMTKIVASSYYPNGTSGALELSYTDQCDVTFSSYSVNSNFDLGLLFTAYFGDAVTGVNLTGKTNKNLVAKEEIYSWHHTESKPATPDETIVYTYQFTGDYLTTITCDYSYSDPAMQNYREVITITYE